MNPVELLISDFLADDLSPTQKEEVLNRIATEQDFAAAVRRQQMELVILEAAHRAELKTALADKIASQPKARNIRPLWIGLGIAAAIAILILIFNPFAPHPSTQQLAMSHLEPFPVQQIRGEPSQSAPAIQLYQTGQYLEAVQAFSTLDLSKPDLALMYASALLQVKAYKQAIEVLKAIDNPGAFSDIYSWNLALAYVLDRQYPQAQLLLKEISSSTHFKQQEAQELLASAPLSQWEGE